MQLPENWLRFSSVTMVRGSACIAILFGIYVSYEVGHQAYSRALKSQISRQAGQIYNTKSWHRILPIKTVLLGEKTQGDEQMLPFSPVDFQRDGVRLVSWIPSAAGGDMSLETPWLRVPPTFTMLAERGMQVSAFSLNAEKGVLRFTLQLVRDDEP